MTRGVRRGRQYEGGCNVTASARKARSQHGGGCGHQPLLTKTLGNLDRQEAPLEALARLIIHLLPSMRVIKDTAGDRRTQPQPAIFGRETYMAEGPKIASAPSRNGVIAGPIKH